MSLEKRTKTALDELRMLMLGAQILLGFQLQAPFQSAFDALSAAEKAIIAIVLGIMIVVLGLLIAPSAWHRIVEGGEASPGINLFVTQIASIVLLPFGLAMALDASVAVYRVSEFAMFAVGAAVAIFLVAMLLWYGPAALVVSRRIEMPNASHETSIEMKIEYVLTEARVVLPGVQALLGFQLAIVLTDAFGSLPAHYKWVHVWAIGAITLATALLIATASCHRMVYGGANSEGFHRVASALVLGASFFLALGIALDVDVVLFRISHHSALSFLAGLSAGTILLGLWLVWPWLAQRGSPKSS